MLIEELTLRPYRFDFFQAVRLLGLLARKSSPPAGGGQRGLVGRDRPPQDEIVRFRALAAHTFPAGPIHSFGPVEDADGQTATHRPPEMVVSFLGLTGPSGVLPQHYTQTVIDRMRQKDQALAEFLDLFNHRIVSHFYRVWEKYHFPFGYETAALDPDRTTDDPFTHGLYCLIGLGTGGLRNRLETDDEGFLYYAGQFAHYPRTAVSLQALISDYFGLPSRVLQFQGQWLALSVPDQTCFPSPGDRGGGNHQLGVTAVVGERVWGIESKFRVQLGPLSYDQFVRLTPLGDRLVPLGQFIRTYVGPDLDFDLQLVLRRDEVPECRLGGDVSGAARLGWNTWVRGRPLPRDAGDAVFSCEGLPSL